MSLVWRRLYPIQLKTPHPPRPQGSQGRRSPRQTPPSPPESLPGTPMTRSSRENRQKDLRKPLDPPRKTNPMNHSLVVGHPRERNQRNRKKPSLKDSTGRWSPRNRRNLVVPINQKNRKNLIHLRRPPKSASLEEHKLRPAKQVKVNTQMFFVYQSFI